MQELEPKVQGGGGLYARGGVIAGFYGISMGFGPNNRRENQFKQMMFLGMFLSSYLYSESGDAILPKNQQPSESLLMSRNFYQP